MISLFEYPYKKASIFQRHHFCSKRCLDLSFRYGMISNKESKMTIKRHLDNQTIEKQYETKRKNNSFVLSEPEDILYICLSKHFQKDDIYRQKFVNRWPIDFT